MNKFWRYTGVMIILVGLPLFAWYFLEKGTVMRKDSMRSLAPKVALGYFETQTENDVRVTPESLKGKRWLVCVMGRGDERFQLSDIVRKLYSQSQEEFHPHFLIITGLSSGEAMPSMSQLMKFPSNNQDWLISYMAEDHIYPFTQEVFSVPESFRNKPCIILIDDKLQIRNYYSVTDNRDMQKLVREYPVFLSLKEKNK